MTDFPKSLLPIRKYMARAREVEQRSPLVSYYCKLFSLRRGIEIRDKADPAANRFIAGLLETCESEKVAIGSDDGTHRGIVEQFALSVFDVADNEDRENRHTKDTHLKFYAAMCFIEVCSTFAPLTSDLQERLQYARWKVKHISTAFREGTKPLPGGPGEHQAILEQLEKETQQKEEEALRAMQPSPEPASEPGNDSPVPPAPQNDLQHQNTLPQNLYPDAEAPRDEHANDPYPAPLHPPILPNDFVSGAYRPSEVPPAPPMREYDDENDYAPGVGSASSGAVVQDRLSNDLSRAPPTDGTAHQPSSQYPSVDSLPPPPSPAGILNMQEGLEENFPSPLQPPVPQLSLPSLTSTPPRREPPQPQHYAPPPAAAPPAPLAAPPAAPPVVPSVVPPPAAALPSLAAPPAAPSAPPPVVTANHSMPATVERKAPAADPNFEPSFKATSEAQKMAKYASSALDFQDFKTAISNLEEALELLRGTRQI